MASKLVKELPRRDPWLYELKYDGYRAPVLKDGADLELRSRSNNDDLTAPINAGSPFGAATWQASALTLSKMTRSLAALSQGGPGLITPNETAGKILLPVPRTR